MTPVSRTLPYIPYKKVVRKLSRSGKASFSEKVCQTDLVAIVDSASTLDDSAYRLESTLSEIYISCFPTRTIRFRDSEPRWLKASLKMLIDDRDRAYAQGKRKKCLRLRQKVIEHTKYLTSEFIRNSCSRYEGTKLWSCIRTIGKGKTSKSCVDKFLLSPFRFQLLLIICLMFLFPSMSLMQRTS